jgi:hypothetical protein
VKKVKLGPFNGQILKNNLIEFAINCSIDNENVSYIFLVMPPPLICHLLPLYFYILKFVYQISLSFCQVLVVLFIFFIDLNKCRLSIEG